MGFHLSLKPALFKILIAPKWMVPNQFSLLWQVVFNYQLLMVIPWMTLLFIEVLLVLFNMLPLRD
jgi:hypothetical protein